MTLLALASCKQEPTMPSDAEITQKMTDKYGAELQNLKDLRQSQCNETLNQKVGERLAAAAAPAPTK